MLILLLISIQSHLLCFKKLQLKRWVTKSDLNFPNYFPCNGLVRRQETTSLDVAFIFLVLIYYDCSLNNARCNIFGYLNLFLCVIYPYRTQTSMGQIQIGWKNKQVVDLHMTSSNKKILLLCFILVLLLI